MNRLASRKEMCDYGNGQKIKETVVRMKETSGESKDVRSNNVVPAN